MANWIVESHSCTGWERLVTLAKFRVLRCTDITRLKSAWEGCLCRGEDNCKSRALSAGLCAFVTGPKNASACSVTDTFGVCPKHIFGFHSSCILTPIAMPWARTESTAYWKMILSDKHCAWRSICCTTMQTTVDIGHVRWLDRVKTEENPSKQRHVDYVVHVQILKSPNWFVIEYHTSVVCFGSSPMFDDHVRKNIRMCLQQNSALLSCFPPNDVRAATRWNSKWKEPRFCSRLLPYFICCCTDDVGVFFHGCMIRWCETHTAQFP